MISYDISKLEKARILKGWTKSNIANQLGLSPSTISAIFQGMNKRADTMKRLAELLGINLEEILIEEESQLSRCSK